MVKFAITARFKHNDNIFEVEKIISKKETLDDNKKLIYKRKIETFFKNEIKEICLNENIEAKELILDSFAINPVDKETYITYFENKNKTLEISASKRNIIKPTLRGQIIDNNCIKWEWDYSEHVSYLIDSENNVISQNAIGVNYFIETELEFGKTYSRTVVISTLDGLSEESNVCSITIDKKKEEYIENNYQIEKRNEDIFVEDNNICSRMEAFQSGIGDRNDLLVLKSDDASYTKRFKLINKIYGIRANKNIKHNTIKFGFRFKLKGLVNKLGYDSKFKLNVTAREISNKDDYSAPIYVGEEMVSPTAEYKLCNEAYVADIHMISLFHSLNLNFKKRYEFKINIFDVEGEIEILSYAHGYILCNSNAQFTERGYFDHKLSVIGVPKQIVNEYEEIYPPLNYDPIYGAVNGDFSITENGLKEMRYKMPEFDTSEFVYDKKYYCMIEDISPKTGYVQYKFDNAANTNEHTLVEEDMITFSSNAILEDNKEYKEFLTQIETNEYSISDNRKYIYGYVLKDIQVDQKRFKRFELEVVPSNNDVVILENTTSLNVEDNFVNTNVTVSVRAIQNAIARWNPVIHSGYYYLNNDEYFLYSKCISDGDGRILNEEYLINSLSVRTSIEALEPKGEIEKYSVTLKTKDDLLVDTDNFFFENERIYPKPKKIVEDYFYEFDEEYTYTSKPIIFPKEPTSLNLVDYVSIENFENEVDVYIRPFNSVYGEWDDLIKIDKPADLKSIPLSKVYTFVVKLRPGQRPLLTNRDLKFYCEQSYDNYKDAYLTRCVNYEEEVLRNSSKGIDGIYVSKTFDLGYSLDKSKHRSLKFTLDKLGDVEFYVQQSDTEEAFEIYNGDWEKINIDERLDNIKRFFRFKIIIKNNSAILNMTLNVDRFEYSDMALDAMLPSFSNLRIDSTYDPDQTTKIYEDVLSFKLPYNSESKVVISDLKEYVKGLSNVLGFDNNRVNKVKIEPYGDRKDDFVVSYDSNIPLKNLPVKASSKSIIYDYELIENSHYGVIYPVKNNSVTISPIPQQYSPSIVYKIKNDIQSKNPLVQVPFFNDREFVIYNEEEFIYEEFNTFYLEYSDIDLNNIFVEINGEITEEYDIINNILKIREIITIGSNVKIRYSVKDSYCLNYDYENDLVRIDINSDCEMVKVFIETNKLENTRKVNHISLNPIYSTVYDGYIYITDYSYKPSKVEIYSEDKFIFANGKDTMTLLVKVTDKNSNPVEGVSVNCSCSFGSIDQEEKKTDTNGIISLTYTSYTENAIDVIKAITSNGVIGEVSITNRVL